MTIKQSIGKFFFKHMPFSRHVFDHIRLEINSIYVKSPRNFYAARAFN